MITVNTNTVDTPIYTVAKCLKELIVNKNIDEAIQLIVQWLSESLDIDRCYIFEHCADTGQQKLFKGFSYSKSDGRRGDLTNTADFSLFNINTIPELKNIVERKKSLKVSTNNRTSAELQLLLGNISIQSLLLIPVFSAGEIWGFIGFADTHNIRTWRNTEQELQSLASAIGMALESKRISDDITQTNKAYSSTLSDIKERLEYEKNINQISNQLTHLINNIDDVYAIYDLKRAQFDFVSKNIETLFECSKEVFISHGLLWKEIIHIEDALGVEKEMHEIIYKKFKGEFFYRIATPNGVTKMLLEKVTVSKDKYGNPEKLYIVKTDYTHIENAEQSLIETERKFRFISENISDFISIHDPDWHFTYASPSIRNVLGYEPEEILGLGGFDFVHPDDLIRTLDDALQPIVLERKETQLRYRMKAKNGEYKWVETYSKPVIDYKGETSSIISSTRDVTDQVNAENLLKASVNEREKLLIELEQSLAKERELNELRSMFVSTASHQFRTPLTVIQSGVEIMEMYLDDLPGEKQERFQRQFNKIQTEVERLQYLMSDILLLGRANAARTPFQPQTQDLVQFCMQIIEEKYNNRYPDDRKILFTVSANQQPVDFDPKLIAHAIENILSNAYKYSERGNLGFDLSFTETEVKIAISDPGIGIPDEELKNLFQPFYRASNTNEIEGTGLGLAIMKEFVDKHSGKIFVTSILNKGTTVNVILPIKQI